MPLEHRPRTYTSRPKRFALGDAVSFRPPDSDGPMLDGIVVAVVRAWRRRVYTVKHSGGIERQVPVESLRERPVRAERVYRGYANGNEPKLVVVEEGDKTRTLADEHGEVHDFNWGYIGGGPGRLAHALVTDLLGEDDHAVAERLKWHLVLCWATDEPWTLLEHHLRADIESIRADAARNARRLTTNNRTGRISDSHASGG